MIRELELFIGLLLIIVFTITGFISKHILKNQEASYDLLKVIPVFLVPMGIKNGLDLICYVLTGEDSIFGKFIDYKPAILIGGLSLIWLSIAGSAGCLKKVIGIDLLEYLFRPD